MKSVICKECIVKLDTPPSPSKYDTNERKRVLVSVLTQGNTDS